SRVFLDFHAHPTAYDVYKIQQRLWNAGAQAEGLWTIAYLSQGFIRTLDSRLCKHTQTGSLGQPSSFILERSCSSCRVSLSVAKFKFFIVVLPSDRLRRPRCDRRKKQQRSGNSYYALLPNNLLFHFGHRAFCQRTGAF